MNPLTCQGHLFGALFAVPQIEDLWSGDRFLSEFAAFETALAQALAEAGVVAPETAAAAVRDIGAFRPDQAAIAACMGVDGVPVPEFLRQLKRHVSRHGHPALHIGATSQDLVDTATVRILCDVNDLLRAWLAEVLAAFDTLAAGWGDAPMTGRTRMQAALPIRVYDRIAPWKHSLENLSHRIEELQPRLARLQFGGPVGNRAALGDKADAVAEALARRLGLGEPGQCWHTARESFAEYAGWLSMLTGALGKAGQDIALMAQQGVDEVALSGAGTSSAMPHKHNPVRAEMLVTLARFNATLLANMHHALVHEQERSGTAWTLEWMTLPGMTVTTAKALQHASMLADSIRRMGAP